MIDLTSTVQSLSRERSHDGIDINILYEFLGSVSSSDVLLVICTYNFYLLFQRIHLLFILCLSANEVNIAKCVCRPTLYEQALTTMYLYKK